MKIIELMMAYTYNLHAHQFNSCGCVLGQSIITQEFGRIGS